MPAAIAITNAAVVGVGAAVAVVVMELTLDARFARRVGASSCCVWLGQRREREREREWDKL